MYKTRQFAKAHEYLNQVRKTEDRIRKLEMRKENLRMLATDIANHMSEKFSGINYQR